MQQQNLEMDWKFKLLITVCATASVATAWIIKVKNIWLAILLMLLRGVTLGIASFFIAVFVFGSAEDKWLTPLSYILGIIIIIVASVLIGMTFSALISKKFFKKKQKVNKQVIMVLQIIQYGSIALFVYVFMVRSWLQATAGMTE